MEIDEMIADALAEETAQKNADNKRGFKPFNDEPMVTVPLKEYLSIYARALDYSRLVEAVVADSKLNWNRDALILDGKTTLEAVRVLIPDIYAETLRSLQDAGAAEGD